MGPQVIAIVFPSMTSMVGEGFRRNSVWQKVYRLITHDASILLKVLCVQLLTILLSKDRGVEFLFN